MITLLVEDLSYFWRVECDLCGFTLDYTTSEQIKYWNYRKSVLLNTEKHYCPTCVAGFGTV